MTKILKKEPFCAITAEKALNLIFDNYDIEYWNDNYIFDKAKAVYDFLMGETKHFKDKEDVKEDNDIIPGFKLELNPETYDCSLLYKGELVETFSKVYLQNYNVRVMFRIKALIAQQTIGIRVESANVNHTYKNMINNSSLFIQDHLLHTV